MGSTQRALHHMLVVPITVALLLTSFVLTSGPASAQSLTLCYDGAGAYPVHCSVNSQRWFRVQCDRGADTTALISLTLSGSLAGGPFNPSLTLFPKPRTDYLDGVCSYGVSSHVAIWTIGPFTGVEYFPIPSPHSSWCMGNFYQDDVYNDFQFHGVFLPQGATEFTYADSGVGLFYSSRDDSDTLEWYQSPAAGVDPLTVTPNQLQPDNDNGAGDSTYTFRVQYANGRVPGDPNNNQPPRWGADAPVPGPAANFVNFDLLPEAAPTAADAGSAWPYGDYLLPFAYPWIFWASDDWWIDHTGDYGGFSSYHGAPLAGFPLYEAQVRAEVALIIDGNINSPHFMLRENPNDNEFQDGVIYKYAVQPTDYMNFLDPLFQFRYDQAGPDTQDIYTTGVHGTPASNGYESLNVGRHSYEFWASDDFHPPRGVAHVQVGWPGNQTRVDYVHPRPYVRYWSFGNASYWWERNLAEGYTIEVNPFGYPYDSMQHPDVNPVLSAFPHFPQGSVGEGNVAPWSIVGGEPRLVPNIQYELFNSGTKLYDLSDVISPFERYMGPGSGPEGPGSPPGGRPRQPTHYTNDDTIRPNLANIWDATGPTPFAGGKWTTSTQFTFLANYWRKPSQSPSYIRVMIRKNDHGTAPTPWTGYTMQQVDPSDGDYSDGAVFRFQATPNQLPGGGAAGDYNYYFVAGDGTRTTMFPNRPPLWTDSITGGQSLDWDPLLPGDPYQATGIPQSDMGVPVDPEGANDYYTFRVNHAPVLSNNDVTPASGRVGDNFVYHVTYTDVDGQLLNPAARGDEPYKALIWIDLFGDPQGENHVSSVATGRLNYTTAAGVGYPAGSLVDANDRYLVRIEEAANQRVVGYQYEITANDTTSITATPVTSSGARGLGIDPISPGDRFEILQWFRGTMSKEDPTDSNAADGIVYRFDTANLITLLEGTHRYYFEFWDDWGDWVYPDNPDVSVEGERVRFPQTSEFTGPEVLKNTAPELTNYRFTPDAPGTGSDGTTATPFRFFVTYTDDENDPPALIRLGIDGTADAPATVLDMVPSDPNDIVYTDGAVFETPTIQLEAGDHIFRAQATDGELSYPPRANPNDPLLFSGPPNPGGSPPRYDSWPGPKVAQNTPPQLLFPTGDAPPAAPSPGLDPDAGTHLTTFTYTIIYKDTDVYAGVQGNEPAWVRVYIDGGVHEMPPVDPSDTNYTDGATFQFQITDLVAGTAHSYYFLTNDGRDNARKPPFTAPDKQYTGPRVDEPPGAPQTLVVADVPNDQGGAVEGNFNPSNDDGGGANDVTEYRVYRSLASTMANPVLALKVPATGAGSYAFVDGPDSLSPPPKNVPLWYIVRAWDGTNESIDSNIGSATGLDNIAPAPPTNLAVTNPGLGRQLNLSWTKSADDGAGADDVSEYHIYRASTSGGYTAMLASVPAGTASYTDPTVDDGTDYFYVVRAYDGINESADSNEAGPVQSTDNQPPILSDFVPAPGARDVPVDTTIAFSATDSGAGVNAQSLVFTATVGGTAVQGNMDQTPITNGYRFVFTPSASFNQLNVVQVHIEVSDLAVPTPRTVVKDYRFTINPPPTYAISGTISFDNGQGQTSPLEGVKVYAGALSGVSDASGAYTINGLTNGSYEVRPEKRGYAFQPPATNVTVQDAAVPGIDFTAVTGYDISGRVTTHGRGVEGVRVTSGLNEAVTNASGRYTIKDSPAGTYTVQPSYPGYAFTPPQQTVTLVAGGGGATGVDFEAGPETFTIQGTVSTSDGGRLADALVTAVRDGHRRASARTEAGGTYALQGLPAGTYTVSVSKPGFSFDPASLDVTVGPNSINNDFLAYELFTQAYAAGLSFLAVPVAPPNPDIVAALGTNNIARWDPNRAGADKYVRASVDPSNPILDLAPGRGYFVGFATPTTVRVSGTAVRATDPFQFELQSGFNMAGDPYPVDLPWSLLAISPTGPVADFGFLLVPGTRDYELVTDIPELNARKNIPRGAGFWVHSDGATVLTSNPPRSITAAAAAKPRAPKIDANNWVIPVVAGAPGASDLSSRAGILAAARANPARFQVANPPPSQGAVDVYFTNADGDRLACDIRPARSAQTVWQFAVSTDLQDVPITVRLPDLSQVPANLRVTLVDVATGERLYARTLSAHTYNSGPGGERLFRLEVTPERGGNLVIQAATAQPLRAGVTVSYTISRRAAVSVQVRNISGVPIATVLRGQDAQAGRNEATWNLLSDAGTKVPAGVYVVVLDAVASDGQRARAIQRVVVGG